VSGTVKCGYATLWFHIGGVAGAASSDDNLDLVEISNCTISGSITGGEATGESYTGGIAGIAGSFVSITNCTVSSSGSVTAGNGPNIKTGGIVGHL
jgi:hypothetical protein